MNKDFLEMLEKMKEIHQKKATDYTSGTDPFENFIRSNEVANWFPYDYKSFGVLIGTKLARLGALLSKKTEPLNESIEDSFLDLATYCVLMYSFYKQRNPNKQDTATWVKANPIAFKCGCGKLYYGPNDLGDKIKVTCSCYWAYRV